MIFDVYGMGGTVRTVLNVTNYLAKTGYDVEIISVFRHRQKAFFDIDPRIKVTVLHDVVNRDKNQKGFKNKVSNYLMNRKSRLIHSDDEGYHFFSLLTDIKMFNYIKTIQEGIIVSTRPSFNIFTAKYANKGVKIIGQEHLNFSIYPPRMKKSLLKNYIHLDFLATLTDEDTDDYKKLLKKGKVKVEKLTNSIPALQGVTSNVESKVIIAAGRLVEQKGFDLLIESFSVVNQIHPDWQLKIFGSGRDKQKLEDLITEKKLYNHVFLMGPTQNIEIELANSSIYALSSRFEGFGMVIIEAMQCGVPVVSFDCPKGPSEIISHNVDGLLIENGNTEKLANGMIELIENKEKRRAFSVKAMKNVKRYEIENIGQLWEKLIDEIFSENEEHNLRISETTKTF